MTSKPTCWMRRRETNRSTTSTPPGGSRLAGDGAPPPLRVGGLRGSRRLPRGAYQGGVDHGRDHGWSVGGHHAPVVRRIRGGFLRFLTRALHENINERLVSPVYGGEIMKHARRLPHAPDDPRAELSPVAARCSGRHHGRGQRTGAVARAADSRERAPRAG